MSESQQEMANFERRTFEDLRHISEDGGEYWSARELYPVLEYSRWQKFEPVIQKAMTACENSGHSPADHFNHTGKMVILGSEAEREIEDYLLSRYACYLIVQNSNPSKPVIAAGQTYFAIQTRRQELADDEAFQELSEEAKRLFLRNEMREHNKQLVDAARESGVIYGAGLCRFSEPRL